MTLSGLGQQARGGLVLSSSSTPNLTITEIAQPSYTTPWDSFVAPADGVPVGILTTIQHSETAAEILVMAVRRSHHRHGVGAALLRLAELAEKGIRFL